MKTLLRTALALPTRARNKLKRRHSGQIQSACASLLPNVTCIDVGASYFPHPPWESFRRSPRTKWVAVDPNADNLAYVGGWAWPSSVLPVKNALSEGGGEKTLYVTSVDTGSSLLRPVITSNNSHRVDASYFHPVTEKAVQTETLRDVVERHALAGPLLIKLDTQGTELGILRGLGEEGIRDDLLCVELESSLLASPLYEGASKFFEVQPFMESRGFELVALDPISGSLPAAAAGLDRKNVLVECDAVFLLRPDELAARSLEHKLAMLGCYIAYEFYGEALFLLGQIALDPRSQHQREELVRLERLLS